jgi:hypothetical protein
MKRLFLMLALVASVSVVNAHETSTAGTTAPDLVQTMPSTGDYYQGFTRPLTFNRMIPPYALEVTFNKTVHIIFPAPIRYVDLGSAASWQPKPTARKTSCVSRLLFGIFRGKVIWQ